MRMEQSKEGKRDFAAQFTSAQNRVDERWIMQMTKQLLEEWVLSLSINHHRFRKIKKTALITVAGRVKPSNNLPTNRE